MYSGCLGVADDPPVIPKEDQGKTHSEALDQLVDMALQHLSQEQLLSMYKAKRSAAVDRRNAASNGARNTPRRVLSQRRFIHHELGFVERSSRKKEKLEKGGPVDLTHEPTHQTRYSFKDGDDSKETKAHDGLDRRPSQVSL